MTGRALAGVPARYAPWQLRDFATRRGVPIVLVALLLGAQLLLPWRLALGPGWLDGPEGAERLGFALQRLLGTVPLVATLLAINGIVADDRRTGHVRFLFAKPVSAPGYYLQSFAVGLGGTLLAALLLGLLLAWLVTPAAVAPLLLLVALTYVSMGGLGFLLSTLVRLDWIVLVPLWFGAGLAQEVAHRRGGPWPALAELLPPARRLSSAGEALIGGAMPTVADALALLGFGAVCLALAAVALRHRPLVR